MEPTDGMFIAISVKSNIVCRRSARGRLIDTQQLQLFRVKATFFRVLSSALPKIDWRH